jgi:hypothetical protein
MKQIYKDMIIYAIIGIITILFGNWYFYKYVVG